MLSVAGFKVRLLKRRILSRVHSNCIALASAIEARMNTPLAEIVMMKSHKNMRAISGVRVFWSCVCIVSPAFYNYGTERRLFFMFFLYYRQYSADMHIREAQQESQQQHDYTTAGMGLVSIPAVV